MIKLTQILVALFLMVTPSLASEVNQVVVIPAEELHKMIEDKAHFVLIDTRYVDLFNKGHIEGAINLTAEEVNSESLAKVTEDDVHIKIVFYCGDVDCPASNIAAYKAIGAGYKYVYRYSGGYEDWLKHGFDKK